MLYIFKIIYNNITIVSGQNTVYKCSAVDETDDRLATTDIGQKLGAVLWGGGAGSPSNTLWPGPRSTSPPSDTLIHIAVWPQQTWAKNWGLCPFGGGGAGCPSNNVASCIWAEAYLPAKWHLDPSSRLATIDMGRKLGMPPRFFFWVESWIPI